MLLPCKNLLDTIKQASKNSMKQQKNRVKIMKNSANNNTIRIILDTILEKSLVIPGENPGKYLEIQGTVIEYQEQNEHNIRNRTSSGSNRERSVFK
jgi:hypothetical protein